MQITTLKIFCDLVDSESFTEAAERNGVTQSAVSQQMRALEKHYGVTLVERGRKNFAVTAEGEVFLGAAREILDRYNGIESQLGEMRDRVAGDADYLGDDVAAYDVDDVDDSGEDHDG